MRNQSISQLHRMWMCVCVCLRGHCHISIANEECQSGCHQIKRMEGSYNRWRFIQMKEWTKTNMSAGTGGSAAHASVIARLLHDGNILLDVMWSTSHAITRTKKGLHWINMCGRDSRHLLQQQKKEKKKRKKKMQLLQAHFHFTIQIKLKLQMP